MRWRETKPREQGGPSSPRSFLRTRTRGGRALITEPSASAPMGPLPPAPCLLAPPRPGPSPPAPGPLPSTLLCVGSSLTPPRSSHLSVAFSRLLVSSRTQSTILALLCCSGKGISAQPGWAFQGCGTVKCMLAGGRTPGWLLKAILLN